MANARQFMAARTAAWAKSGAPLPYLRRVAYLESHGTEWIDTNIIPDSESSLKVEMQAVSFSNPDQSCGCTVGCGTNNRLCCGLNTSLGWYFGLGSSNALYGTPDFDKHVLLNDLYHKVNKIDDNVVSVSGFNFGSSRGSLYLFARHNAVADAFCIWKIYGSEIRKLDVLVGSFIPVIDLSGRPAMYDEVSGQFFYNQGTGEFTWGELET